jgi:hypothetical protein
MSVRPEQPEDFLSIARTMTESTHSLDSGCITYKFLQEADEPTKAVLFEEWTDQEALSSHLARLIREMGPPAEDESLPSTHHRRRLPAAFVSLFDDTEATRYIEIS